MSDTELLNWLGRQKVGVEFGLGGGWSSYENNGFAPGKIPIRPFLASLIQMQRLERIQHRSQNGDVEQEREAKPKGNPNA